MPEVIAERDIKVPVAPDPKGRCGKKESENRLEDLAILYQMAQWAELQEQADCILSLLDNKDTPMLFLPAVHYYSVIFVAKGRLQEPQVIRFLIHRDSPEAPYHDDLTTRLLGISVDGRPELREVFLTKAPAEGLIEGLSESPIMTLNSTYTFTRVDNPLTVQLADFVKQFPAVIAGIPIVPGTTLGIIGVPSPPPPLTKGTPPPTTVPLRVKVSRVPVVFARAKIEIKDTVTMPDLRTPEEVVKSAHELATGFANRDARLSPVAKELATELDAAFMSEDCSFIPTIACFSNLKKNKIDAIFNKTTDAAQNCSRLIPSRNDCPPFLTPDLQLAILVRNGFVQLATADKPKDFSGTSTIQSSQLNRFAFAAISSVILRAYHADDRVKVANGKLAKDPLSGNLTMGGVNIHLVPYDPEAEHMTVAERFRLFAGGVIVPNFGVGGGLSVGIIRGLSLNVGYAQLIVSKLGGNEALDAVPKSTNPFKVGTAGVTFIGAGLNFK